MQPLTGTDRVEREERATKRFEAGIIRRGNSIDSRLRVPNCMIMINVIKYVPASERKEECVYADRSDR